MADFSERVVLVTGGNRGLGFEVARQLLDRGFHVLLAARNPERSRQAVARLDNSRVHPVTLDVTRPDHADACRMLIQRQFGGRLDVLVNNAAIHYDDDETASIADLRIVTEALETNLVGAWRLAQMAAQLMRPRHEGTIVNVSSGAGAMESLTPSTPAYSLSKLALNGLTRMLASELVTSGIVVNAVCPGWVATDMGGPGGRPVQDGARGIVWAALLTSSGPTGGFFRDGQPIAW